MGRTIVLRRLFLTGDRRPALFWRLAGYALLFGGCLWLRGLAQSSLELAFDSLLPGAWGLLFSEMLVLLVIVGVVLGLTWIFRRWVDRRPWSGMALPAPWRRRRDLAAGFGLGVFMMLLVFGIENALGWLRIVGVKEGFTGSVACTLIAARLLHFVTTAVCEETAYRGYLLQNVSENYPLWVGGLSTGAVFALSHFAANGFTWGFLIGGILVSFFLTNMRLLTRAIWLGVGWHLGWDWLEDGLGLTPGYSVLETERNGPPLWIGQGLAIEGGLLIILILAGGLLLLQIWSPRRSLGIWTSRLSPEGAIHQGAPPREDSPGGLALDAPGRAADGGGADNSKPDGQQ